MHLINKGNRGYLAVGGDVEAVMLSLEQVPMVKKFPDVFPEELAGMHPNRGIEFYIDLALSVQFVSIFRYHMALAEL